MESGHPLFISFLGTIYVAFGTYPDWNLAPERILSALIDAFKRLSSYRIIFAYNGPPIPGLGPHIMLTKWAPQLEILAHPMTKAYITHGGLKRLTPIFGAFMN
jgi:glucuronosyltransferase